jgi:hypothetical protein
MRSIATPRVLTDAGFLFSGSGSIFFIFLLVLCSHRVRVLFPLGNRRGGSGPALAQPEVLVVVFLIHAYSLCVMFFVLVGFPLFGGEYNRPVMEVLIGVLFASDLV